MPNLLKLINPINEQFTFMANGVKLLEIRFLKDIGGGKFIFLLFMKCGSVVWSVEIPSLTQLKSLLKQRLKKVN